MTSFPSTPPGTATLSRRTALAAVGAALAAPWVHARAAGLGGGRTVTLVVSYPAGGGADLMARILAPRMAEALGLDDVRAPIRQLSTGNRLRAALIGALIHRPALALLDEPTLGLDLEGVERLQALVRQGTREGQTFLISSHDLHFIERLCPRIVCIHQGRKRFDGPREAFTHLPHPYRLKVRHPAPCPALPDWLAGRRWERQDEDWTLPLKDPAEVMRLAALWPDWLAASEQLQLRRIDLREHYLDYLEQGRENVVAPEARP